MMVWLISRSPCKAWEAAPISIAGSPELKARYLPRVIAGKPLPPSHSQNTTRAPMLPPSAVAHPNSRRIQVRWREKWISNGGIADFYCVFARTSGPDVRADGTTSAEGITAIVVDAGTPGLSISQRIDTISPHPLATLTFHDCKVSLSQRLGAEGWWR